MLIYIIFSVGVFHVQKMSQFIDDGYVI